MDQEIVLEMRRMRFSLHAARSAFSPQNDPAGEYGNENFKSAVQARTDVLAVMAPWIAAEPAQEKATEADEIKAWESQFGSLESPENKALMEKLRRLKAEREAGVIRETMDS
jgi:hypothetical protein